MSEQSKALLALQDAFRELGKTASDIDVEDAASMPSPKNASDVLKRIRENQKKQNSTMTTNSPFKSPSDRTQPLSLAAREGGKITPEILQKMKENRKNSD